MCDKKALNTKKECQPKKGICSNSFKKRTAVRALSVITMVARWFLCKPKIQLRVNFRGLLMEKGWCIFWPF
jgi:hypothetical protein